MYKKFFLKNHLDYVFRPMWAKFLTIVIVSSLMTACTGRSDTQFDFSQAESDFISIYALTVRDSAQLPGLQNQLANEARTAQAQYPNVVFYKSLTQPVFTELFESSADILVFIKGKKIQETQETFEKVYSFNLARLSIKTGELHTSIFTLGDDFYNAPFVFIAKEQRLANFLRLDRKDKAALMASEDRDLKKSLPLSSIISLQNMFASQTDTLRIVTFPEDVSLNSALAAGFYNQSVRRIESFEFGVYARVTDITR